VHRGAALAARRPVAGRAGRNPAGGEGQALLDGAGEKSEVKSQKSERKREDNSEISRSIFALAETGETKLPLGMFGGGAGGNILHGLAAGAATRRATSGEHRTVFESRTSVRPISAAGAVSLFEIRRGATGGGG